MTETQNHTPPRLAIANNQTQNAFADHATVKSLGRYGTGAKACNTFQQLHELTLTHPPGAPTPIPPATLARTAPVPGPLPASPTNIISAELAGAALRSMSTRTDPVHLFSIARELGVGGITVDPNLDRPGRVIWDRATPVIAIRGGIPENRRRWALAHELGHVMLRHGDPEANPNPMTADRFRAEERMADATAAALLVPPDHIEQLRQLDRVRLDDIRALADQHVTSLSVIVNRLRHADPRPSILLELYRSPVMWETRRLVGGVTGLPDQLDVLPEQYPILEQLPECDVPLVVRARMGRHIYELGGDGNRRGSTVLLFINSVRFVADASTY